MALPPRRPDAGAGRLPRPELGYALAAASDRTLRTLGVGFAALLVVLGTFGRLWRDAGEQHAWGEPRVKVRA